MWELQEVKAIEQSGLQGDRYASGRGAWSQSKRKGGVGQVSLIEQEALGRANANLKIAFLPGETRRNIVVSNFPLNGLIGKEFVVGTVRMRGVELCTPCERPSKLANKSDFKESFTGYGGLYAEILNTGIIKVGDPVETL